MIVLGRGRDVVVTGGGVTTGTGGTGPGGGVGGEVRRWSRTQLGRGSSASLIRPAATGDGVHVGLPSDHVEGHQSVTDGVGPQPTTLIAALICLTTGFNGSPDLRSSKTEEILLHRSDRPSHQL